MMIFFYQETWVMPDKINNTLERLETGMLFIERNVEKMNEVIYEHQQQLSLLGKQMQEIKDQLANAPGEIIDKKPPHY